MEAIGVFHEWSCCSVAMSCLTFCDPMDCGMPGFSVPQHLPKFAQVHVYWTGDAIQPFHPLSSPSPAFNLPVSGSFPVSWLITSRNEVHKFKLLELEVIDKDRTKFSDLCSINTDLLWSKCYDLKGIFAICRKGKCNFFNFLIFFWKT